MDCKHLLLFLMLTLAGAGTDAASQPRPPARKVLVIGLDGVRVDVLAQADTPHLDRLAAAGTFSAEAQTRMPTVSGPGWSSMVTGVWSDKHGVRSNDFSANDYAAYPDFLTRLERIDPSFATFAVLNWPPLGTAAAGGPMISDTIDVKITLDGDSLGYDVADARAVEWAVHHLATEAVDAAFVYLGNIDVVGHEAGSLAPAYRAAIETADAQVGRLVAALHRRPNYAGEDWLILMSTDHGRRDDGGHGGPSTLERRIFFLASGPSVLTGTPETPPEIVDVAVTALTHLGIAIDPAWKLDGRAVGLRP